MGGEKGEMMEEKKKQKKSSDKGEKCKPREYSKKRSLGLCDRFDKEGLSQVS